MRLLRVLMYVGLVCSTIFVMGQQGGCGVPPPAPPAAAPAAPPPAPSVGLAPIVPKAKVKKPRKPKVSGKRSVSTSAPAPTPKKVAQ